MSTSVLHELSAIQSNIPASAQLNNCSSFPPILVETKLVVAEYIFIDGFGTTRSKTRIIQGKLIPGQEACGLMFSVDVWNVDGSNTGQSDIGKSDVILMPRTLLNDPFNESRDGIQYCLAMCDVMNIDGTPHSTNNRAVLYNTMAKIGETVIASAEPLFGIEQEYVITEVNGNKDPYGWTTEAINMQLRGGIKKPEESIFYCGVGSNCAFGRKIAMEHMNKCIQAGIMICGVNAEVTPSQWEFQIGVCNPFQMGDHLWMARYILGRVSELHNVCISYDPKPFGNKWNGSGAHTNFSTKDMRSDNGIEAIKQAIDKLSFTHLEHIAVYGKDNERRLTGIHESSDINTFTYGECDRGSSVRIPINVLAEGRGYFEDRRPAANADPYLVVAKILETIL